jgi:hypothetical protein
MLEVSPGNNENERNEEWHIRRIVDAIHQDDVEQVLRELQIAWKDGFKITHSGVRVDKVEDPSVGPDPFDQAFQTDISDAIDAYFTDLVQRNQLTVEERIRIFNFLLPHDAFLATTMVERVEDEEEDDDPDMFTESVINSPDLYPAQDILFEWHVDNDNLESLHSRLDKNKCIGDHPVRELPEKLRVKIVDFAKRKLEAAEAGYAQDKAEHWTWKIDEAKEIIKFLDY